MDFDFDKPWSIDELPQSIREQVEKDFECEPGKMYIGCPPEEILCCPFCKRTFSFETKCEHFVFCYGWTNGKYEEIDPHFKRFFLSAWSNGEFNSDGEDLFENLRPYSETEQFPHPEDMAQLIPDLQLRELYDLFGVHGEICGFIKENKTYG